MNTRLKTGFGSFDKTVQGLRPFPNVYPVLGDRIFHSNRMMYIMLQSFYNNIVSLTKGCYWSFSNIHNLDRKLCD